MTKHLLSEIIDMSRPFELGVKRTLKRYPDKTKIKGMHLQNYFGLDDIKTTKDVNGGANIHAIYKHNETGEMIDILWHEIRDNEMTIYKNFTNPEVIKHFISMKKMPHVGDDTKHKEQEWKYDRLDSGV
jgi:hypothetical protein